MDVSIGPLQVFWFTRDAGWWWKHVPFPKVRRIAKIWCVFEWGQLRVEYFIPTYES